VTLKPPFFRLFDRGGSAEREKGCALLACLFRVKLKLVLNRSQSRQDKRDIRQFREDPAAFLLRQTATIVNREATEMTLVLGRRIPMKGDVLFQVAIVVGLVRTVSAVKTVLIQLRVTSLRKDDSDKKMNFIKIPHFH